MNTPVRMMTCGALVLAYALLVGPAGAQDKPNILVIFGDDVGYWNISAYNRGMMGYRTPNIDRMAREGAIFTDYYGQQLWPHDGLANGGSLQTGPSPPSERGTAPTFWRTPSACDCPASGLVCGWALSGPD
jgi:hypothetical protein